MPQKNIKPRVFQTLNIQTNRIAVFQGDDILVHISVCTITIQSSCLRLEATSWYLKPK